MIDCLGCYLALAVTPAQLTLFGARPETGVTSQEETAKGGGDSAGDELPAPVSLNVFYELVFYDMYAATVDEPLDEGVVRHSNALYATRLSDRELASIQNTLTGHLWIGALCDNYDRLGGVFLSLVPRGAQAYSPGSVMRLEIARFITPFMDMNRTPEPVPYTFELDNIVAILKDEELTATHDVWIELSVEGVPYAANREVAGCADRNDVFWGILELSSDSAAAAPDFDLVIPVATRAPLNNYEEGASDELGTTRKTLEFTLEEDTARTQLVLITSNHGANEGGEEYNRRDHFVHVDGEEVLAYRPGRESCEPFRAYNTQNNGIYGPNRKSDQEWQSFSNWCPGDVIDTRIIELGAMQAGPHEFVIDVPDAVFAEGQGNIPLSLYVQGQRGAR